MAAGAYSDRRHQLPLWVISGPTAAPPGRSAPGGKADEIGGKADIAPRRSAFGVTADALAYPIECPLIATTGHVLAHVIHLRGRGNRASDSRVGNDEFEEALSPVRAVELTRPVGPRSAAHTARRGVGGHPRDRPAPGMFCGMQSTCPVGHKKLICLTYRAPGPIYRLYIVSRLRLREAPPTGGTKSREQ